MSLVNNRMFIVFCYQIAVHGAGDSELPKIQMIVLTSRASSTVVRELIRWLAVCANFVEQRHTHTLCTQCLPHTSMFNLFYIAMIYFFAASQERFL